MKVFILNITITEDYSNVTLYRNTYVFNSRELAQEYIDGSPNWSADCNSAFNYYIQEQELLSTFNRDALAEYKSSEDEECNQAYNDYDSEDDSYLDIDESDFQEEEPIHMQEYREYKPTQEEALAELKAKMEANSIPPAPDMHDDYVF